VILMDEQGRLKAITLGCNFGFEAVIKELDYD
jgi:hypothetical protein